MSLYNVHAQLYIHKHVCTYYIHLYIFMYMYMPVHVVMYLYVHGIDMSVPCSDTYVPFCPILSRWVGFQMMS